MEIEEAINHALDGDAVLFTGAGFSIGALNLKGEPFKTSRQFAAFLSKTCGSGDDVSLEIAAEDYREKFGDDALIAEVQNEFTTKAVSSHHIEFTAVPWRRIYTTNYDNVMEFACAKKGLRLSPVIPGNRIQDVPKRSILCVHLNGFIDRLTRGSLERDFKLLETAYLRGSLADSPWISLFRTDIANARAVFFVGYALGDLDITRVLFPTDSVHDKCFFVLGSNPIRALVRRSETCGKAIAQDTEQFAKLIALQRPHYTPREPTDEPRSLTKFHLPTDSARPRDADVFDLLLLGSIQLRFIWESLQKGSRYFLRRSIVRRIIDAVEDGKRTIAIYSALGNGKSLILEGLRFEAFQRGYDVYSLTNTVDNLASDIDLIRKRTQKALLLVDNYSDRLDELRYIAGAAPDTLSVVLAARTVIHDVLIDELEDIFPSGITEFSADILSDDDLEWVRQLLDEFGLWGKRAAHNERAKRTLLKQECRAEFHQILLMVLESPQIRTRLEEIQTELLKASKYSQTISTTLILSVLGYDIDINFLSDVLGEDIIRTPDFRKNPAVRQLVSFDTGRVVMRSAVVSEYLLTHITNPTDTAEVLIQIAKALDKCSITVPHYNDILVRVMRFSTLQELLPESGRLAAVFTFYESVKNLAFCQTNPLFWLQYAIAALTLRELPRAETYFDTAYS
jgi:hypothetical protein